MKKIIGAAALMIGLGTMTILADNTAKAAEDTIVVEINEENFPDDIFRDYILNGSHYIWDEEGNQIEVVYDANKDGKLSESELANIHQILVSESGISDLTGIEYFTSVIELDCQRTPIKTLDVSALTELQILNCYKCELEGTLDLSGNVKLEGVACHGNRNLTAINVTNCPVLSSLDFSSTGVTTIDLSKNIKLQQLACADTAITELDLSSNAGLMNLACYNTQITELDLSKNVILEYIDCSNNNISALDISNNPELTYLLIPGTNIEGIDVSELTKLTHISVTGGNIAWLNVGNNPNLQVSADENTISMTVPAGSFDITEMLPGIDAGKITIVSGAEINGNIISGYTEGTPIVYTYNCGTSSAGETILNVTVNLETAEDQRKPDDGTQDAVTPPDNNKNDTPTVPDSDKDNAGTTKKPNVNKVKKTPATGDTTNVMILLLTLGVSGCVIEAVVVMKKRNR